MQTRHALLAIAVFSLTLSGAGAVAHATTYTANTWDCTQGNASTACAQADLPALSIGRSSLATVRGPDGFIYALGGYTRSAPTYAVSAVNTVEAFSVGTGWVPVAPMPTSRYDLATVSIPGTGKNGYLYVLGGVTSQGAATNVMEVYNTSNNTWGCSYFDPNCSDAQQAYTPLPTPRDGLSATLGTDGRIYTLGGFTNGVDPFSTVVEAYDPTTDTWDCSTGDTASLCNTFTLKPLPTARGYGSAITGADGRIYMIGGQHGALLQTVESYDPMTKTWLCSVGDGGCAPSAQTLAPMPTGRQLFGMVKGGDNRVYAISGNDTTAAGSSSRVEAYSPGSGGGTWICSVGDSACPATAQTLRPSPTPRIGAAAAVGPDGRIYDIGGNYSETVVEAFTIPASAPTAARVSRVAGVRHGVFVDVRWNLTSPRNVVGFLLYGGNRRLTLRSIPMHASSVYRATVRWGGALSELQLHLSLRDGREIGVHVR